MPAAVLHLLASARAESAAQARIVSALARGLDPERYRVHAWFLGGDGPLVAELELAGASVCTLGWERGWRDPRGASRFWRGLREYDFALIHKHIGGGSVRAVTRAATGAKIVAHLHGNVSESGGPSPAAMLVPGADRVIATSRAVAELSGAADPRVIYPGVPVRAPARRPAGNVIGTASRFAAVKGVVHLVRALSALRAELPEVRLEIAGTGPERSALEAAVRALGLDDCVVFLGWQTDLARAFARWDVYVQPSLDEGFGIAALEAMAAGLSVVATAVGGLPELVEDGRSGFLVPPADPRALAERLGALLRDPDLAASLGDAGRARAMEHFSTKRMVSEISAVYDELLRQG